MDELSKALRYNNLLLIYQTLLTDTQKDILSDYYFFDLSISEISENRNVSRAAIEDAIKKGQLKLDKFENELHIFEKNNDIKLIINKLKESSNDEQNKLLEDMERIIENGI